MVIVALLGSVSITLLGNDLGFIARKKFSLLSTVESSTMETSNFA